ncbi:MAG: metallophosphoesterase family protein [Bacteroidales bacterium]|nr:metallophosphoesterase family protein [Bacteroidales bacterium]
MIYLTSDLHLYHKSFIYEPRGFHSAEEMNATIEKNWNELITDDDDVYILGDLIFKGENNSLDDAMKIVNRLKGKKHLILGNHDGSMKIELYKKEPSIVEIEGAKYLWYKSHQYYLSHFPSITVDMEVEKPKDWIVNFFGHTHKKEKFYKGLPFMYNVSLDAHDNRLVSIDDAIADIKVKIEEFVNSR